MKTGAAIAAIYAPYVIETAITFEEVPPTAEEMEARIHETLPRYPYLVGEENGRVVGYVYAGQHGARASYRWSVNVAVYLASSHHRARRRLSPLSPIVYPVGIPGIRNGLRRRDTAQRR